MQSISNSVSPNPLTNCSTSSTISDWLSAYSSPDPHARFRALPKSNSTKSRRSTRWTSVACLQQWPDTERERWVWNLGRIEWRSSLRGLELTISVELYCFICNIKCIIYHHTNSLSRFLITLLPPALSSPIKQPTATFPKQIPADRPFPKSKT